MHHVWIYTQIVGFVMRASGSGGLNDGVASAGALTVMPVGSYDMLITLIDLVTPGPCSVRRNGAGELVV
jgi:hypothetical protein